MDAPEQLKDVDVGSLPMSLSSQGFLQFKNDTSELYRSLLVKWRNETGSPELLQYWDKIDEVKRIVTQFEDLVIDSEALGSTLPFGVDVLFKCEAERMKYMLLEYLRIRLAKIETFSGWLLEDATERRSLMSPAELMFCVKFEAMQRQLTASVVDDVLEGLPAALISHDTARSKQQPNSATHIFAQFTETVHDVTLDPAMESTTIEAGELYVIPYSSVKQYIDEGKAVIV
eukprot:TRINITY_DN8122_c0_g5_i1.p1 TRINITY_DN8122_c0_g5~~TRINITY_DN8122_c0_g5_i1.p1  ORF type:complete len:230 (+),score=45.61 TRINITY_DN8122_c0_g5_i1:32-721(+)